jgi:hypothetical protein
MADKSKEGYMEELFLETKKGCIKIDPKLIEKYNLKEGMTSPFTKLRIVDKHGNFFLEGEKTSSPDADEIPTGEGLADDEIVEFKDTGSILSQSEIIDFGEGTDSSNY